MKVDEVFGPTIQGEGALAGTVTMFVRLGGCDYQCAWCPTPDAPILMGDLTWKPAGMLRVGDAIVGTDRRSGVTPRGHTVPIESIGGYRLGAVLGVLGRKSERLRVHFTDGRSVDVAAEHRFTRFKNSRFVAANKLQAGDTLRWFNVWQEAPDGDDYRTGYLTGAADGDGSFHNKTNGARHFTIATGDGEIIDRVGCYLQEMQFHYTRGMHQHGGQFGPVGHMPILRICSREHRARFETLVGQDHLESESWRLGYIAGLYDTDGSTDSRTIRLTQKKPRVRERAAKIVARQGHEPILEPGAIRVTSDTKVARQLLGRMRPALTRKVWPIMAGRGGHHEYLVVASVEKLAPGDVVSIKTDIGTYVSDGFISRNCDTLHAVLPEYANKWEELTSEQIGQRLAQLALCRPGTADSDINVMRYAYSPTWVTISGGNPAIWQRELPELVNLLQGQGWRINIETQGSVPNDAFAFANVVTLSPKGPSSGMVMNPAKLALCVGIAGPRAVFKFVIGDEADMTFARETAARHPEVPVYAQPVTVKGAFPNLATLCETVAQTPELSHWKVIPQLHVLAWGNERGR